jgi:GxxExxY protein
MEQPTSEQIESLTEKIIGCAIEVHRALGPGLLECVYRDCMLIELRLEGLKVDRDRRVTIEYRGQRVPASLVLDLVVERSVVVELKTVERIHPLHLAQVITYLKLTGCPAGLLMNFNSTSLRGGLRRLDHPALYTVQRPSFPGPGI